MDKAYLKAGIEKKEDDGFVAVASTSTVDRHGEIVNVDGWDLKNFKSNPLILWGHDHDEPAIGKATRIWIDRAGGSPQLKFKAVLSDATARAREVKQLMAEGIIKAFSVGFQPIDMNENEYTKQELLEISAVNVPANPEAMMLAYKSLKKAGFTDDEITEVGIKDVPVSKADFDELKQSIQIMKSQVDSAVKGLKHLNPHIGRDQRIAKERLSMLKVVARASDKILEHGANDQAVRQAKVVKQASQLLIGSVKGEINFGKDKRT